MTTMLDASRHAGVSKATASRVLNGADRVKENTRRKVPKAMRAPDYRPNFLVHSLVNRTNNNIGLVVSTSDGFYSGCLLRQALRQTESHGKQLIVIGGYDTPEHEQEAVQMLTGRQCDAIILYTRYISERVIMSLMNSVAMPLLVTNRDVSQAHDHAVFSGQEDAVYQVVNYLISQGHSDTAYIAMSGHTPTGKFRLMGYRKALEKNGIPWDPDKAEYGDSIMTRGCEVCRELLEEGVKSSALFVCNDNMALGVSRALYQAGSRIPMDVSLFGLDNVPNAKRLEPGLSTVYLPIGTIITTAVDQVIQLANGESVEPIPLFTGKLVLRDSVTLGPYFK